MKPRFTRRSAWTASLAVLSVTVTVSLAETKQWDGSDDIVFSNGLNWTGGAAPVNDLVTDIAEFGSVGPGGIFQPQVSPNRSVGGLSFTTLTGGWTLSGLFETPTAPSIELSLGTAGIVSANTSGTNIISADINALQAGTLFTQATGGTLELHDCDGAAAGMTIGALGNAGTVDLAGLGDNNNLRPTVEYGTVILNKGSGTGVQDNYGSAVNFVTINVGATVEFGEGRTNRGGARANGQIFTQANVNGTLDLKGDGDFSGALSNNWRTQQLIGSGIVTNNGTGDGQIAVKNAGDADASIFNGTIQDGSQKTFLSVQARSDNTQANLTLTGINTFTGGTDISTNGRLLLTETLGNGARLTNSTVTVSSGTELAVQPGLATTTNNSIAGLVLNQGSTLDMTDGFHNTLDITGTADFCSDAGASPQILLDVSDTSSDQIAIAGAASFSQPGAQIVINLTAAPSVSDTFTLATAASGLNSANSWKLANGSVASFGGTAYLFSLSKTPTSAEVEVIASGQTGAFYTGDQGSVLNAESGGDTNWSIDIDGITDLGSQPGLLSDMTFSAFGPVANITELGQNYTVNNLVFINESATISDTAANGDNTISVVNEIRDSDFGNITINVPLIGNAGLIKTGTGILTLNSAIGYLGDTVLNAGTTVLTADNSAATGNTILGTGAILEITAPSNFPGGSFTMFDTNNGSNPELRLTADSDTDFAKPIVLDSTGGGQPVYQISVEGGGGGTYHTIGPVSQLTVRQKDFQINSASGYGLIIPEYSMCPLTGQDNQVQANTPVTIHEVTNPMMGFDDTNYNTLSLEGSADDCLVDGVIEDAVGGDRDLGGYTRVLKDGPGTWTLSADNTYSGVTQIDAGTLLITGSTALFGGTIVETTTVNASGTLGGTGTVGNAINGAGTIAPGVNGVGILTAGTDVDLSTGTLAIEVDDDSSDQLVSNGEITLGGTLDVQLLGGGFTQPSYTIATATNITGTFTSVTPGYQVTNTGTALILSTGTAYGSWIASFTFAPGADLTPAGDPDDDGASNLLEFATNGIPNDGSNNGLQAAVIQDGASTPAGDELTLVCAVRDGASFATVDDTQVATVDGVTYTIEGSLDLIFPGSAVAVAGAPSDTAPVGSGLPDLTGTAWEYHTFSLTASEGLAGKGFLRLEASQP